MNGPFIGAAVVTSWIMAILIDQGVRLGPAAFLAVLLAVMLRGTWWLVLHEVGVRNLRGRTGTSERFTTVSES
jgi:hypothetical protein